MFDDANLVAAADLASKSDTCLVFAGADAGEGC